MSLGPDIAHCFMWSDSTTALAWIKSNDEWGTFVGTRVKEICRLTDEMTWQHVSGVHNPADLPSRGCSSSRLVQSRWWEGPGRLYDPPELWPTQEFAADDMTVRSELKRTALRNSASAISAIATRDSQNSSVVSVQQ